MRTPRVVVRSVGRERSAEVMKLIGELEVPTEPVSLDEVYLDLSGLSFLDSSGIRALVHAQRAMDAAGCHFAVVAPADHVRKSLRIAGVEGTLEIRDTMPS